jgi:hypothetical protein
VTKTAFMQLRRTKFETLQTVEETFANRKTKEKNAPSN